MPRTVPSGWRSTRGCGHARGARVGGAVVGDAGRGGRRDRTADRRRHRAKWRWCPTSRWRRRRCCRRSTTRAARHDRDDGARLPSVRYVYDALAARLGARIVVVPSDDGIGVSEDRLAAIDERTRLVAISHVLFRSAIVMDVARSRRRAHEVGAFCPARCIPLRGRVPVDVRALDADFLTGRRAEVAVRRAGRLLPVRASPSARWRPPALTGWQAHTRPFAFEAEMDYADAAWRWLGGTPVIPALYAATEGPDPARGGDRRGAREERAADGAADRARRRARYPVGAPRDAERRGGTVAFDVPHAYEVSRSCWRATSSSTTDRARAFASRRTSTRATTSSSRWSAMIDDILARDAWTRYTDERAS